MKKKLVSLGLLCILAYQPCSARNRVQFKTFVPGAVQLSHGQKAKAWTIIAGEVFALSAGGLCWHWSDQEYEEYKNLPRWGSQEFYDESYNASNYYGTLSIVSFVGFGAVYTYSVIDAIWFSSARSGEKQGLYLIPGQDRTSLCALLRF